jgi:hypothetical protein
MPLQASGRQQHGQSALTTCHGVRWPKTVREADVAEVVVTIWVELRPTPNLPLRPGGERTPIKSSTKRTPASSSTTSAIQICIADGVLSVHLICEAAPGFDVLARFASQASRCCPSCHSGRFWTHRVWSQPHGEYRRSKSGRGARVGQRRQRQGVGRV